jgi:hypothetical protein
VRRPAAGLVIRGVCVIESRLKPVAGELLCVSFEEYDVLILRSAIDSLIGTNTERTCRKIGKLPEPCELAAQ